MKRLLMGVRQRLLGNTVYRVITKKITQPLAGYFVLEAGDKILLEDGSGLLLEG